MAVRQSHAYRIARSDDRHRGHRLRPVAPGSARDGALRAGVGGAVCASILSDSMRQQRQSEALEPLLLPWMPVKPMTLSSHTLHTRRGAMDDSRRHVRAGYD